MSNVNKCIINVFKSKYQKMTLDGLLKKLIYVVWVI